MKHSLPEMVSLAFLLLAIVFFSAGMLSGDLTAMNAGILLGWTANLAYGLADWRRRSFYVAFQLTFFAFLLGRTVVQLLTGIQDAHSFPDEIHRHTNLCIFLAELSLWLGYAIAERLWPRDAPSPRGRTSPGVDYESPGYRTVRQVSKLLFYVTFPCRVAVQAETMLFMAKHGYASLYVDFASQLPYAVGQFVDVCQVAYFLFLATMPSRKEFSFPTFLYLGSAVLGCLAGRRGDLVVPLLTYVLYCVIRNRINRGPEPWFTRRAIRVLALAAPFLFIVLYSFGVSRFGNRTSSGSSMEKLAGFFNELGFSRNVINYEKLYEDFIPDKLYSIGDTVDYLRENVLTQFFFKFPVYDTQTAEKAMEGHNFSQTITYLYSPAYYLRGRGLGSCYIAEAYHDFGYFGIVLWSFVYCFVLKKVYSFEGKGIVAVALALLALKQLLLSPRTMASGFFSEYVNVNTWLTIAIVFLSARLLGKPARLRPRPPERIGPPRERPGN